MLTQPILNVYPKLKPQQKHYIRTVLWDRYREDLKKYMQAEGNAAPDHIGHIFVATGSDPDGLLVQATELARQDNINSIQDLCLSILQEQLDKTKQELAEWEGDKENERVLDWERDQLRTTVGMIITIFPALRPAIVEFGLQAEQQHKTGEFMSRNFRPGHEQLH